MTVEQLQKLAKLIRYYILTSTTEAGSGHPSSSLSAVELMTALMFSAKGGSEGGEIFRADLKNPTQESNDRLIFSKGHASPLFYSLYAVAGAIEEKELLTMRKFGSRLEGHPTLEFPYTEVPTGSLGQGLSVGVGMALNAKLDKLSYRTYVLLGDSEMSEGSVWEAMACAAHYKLNNLVAILDVNRLGQRGETMHGHHTEVYEEKAKAFGWETIVLDDGHSLPEVSRTYKRASLVHDKPTMIIAKTLKGKGVSFMENKDGWHGKPLKKEELEKALAELGEVDMGVRGEIALPSFSTMERRAALYVPQSGGQAPALQNYPPDKPVSTRRAYGNALARIGEEMQNMVVLDGEVSNSTYSELFKKAYPERFFEMFVAEQNMAGVALGFSRRGKIPFVSTFAAFMTRAFDQIRMGQYGSGNIKFCGSHAGVSIGEDGASQMGLEDIAMFRTLLGSVVLYPSDAISTERLVEQMVAHHGIAYLRTTRMDTPILYGMDEQFPIGGSKVLRESANDAVTIVGAGVTLHEALAAHEELKKEGIAVRVIDLYSIKPIDVATLQKAARETRAIITVEDHFAEGGIGEAVASALSNVPPLKLRGGEGALCPSVYILAVRKMPKSGKPSELLDYEEISRSAIIKKVKTILIQI
ncbi:MAG: transketolase [bacterium]|nr:transketolase [bacterium]